MNIRSITVKYGRKFDLGNYNSATIEELRTGDLDEGDDPATCAATLFQAAKADVKAQALPLFTKAIDEQLEIVAALPPELRDELLARLQERLNRDAD